MRLRPRCVNVGRLDIRTNKVWIEPTVLLHDRAHCRSMLLQIARPRYFHDRVTTRRDYVGKRNAKIYINWLDNKGPAK